MTARSTDQPTLKKNKQKGNTMIMIITEKSKRKQHTQIKEKHKTYDRPTANAAQTYNQSQTKTDNCLVRMKRICTLHNTRKQ